MLGKNHSGFEQEDEQKRTRRPPQEPEEDAEEVDIERSVRPAGGVVVRLSAMVKSIVVRAGETFGRKLVYVDLADVSELC